MATNTLTQPDGFQPDAQPSAADPGAGAGESNTLAGSHSSKPAPHLRPASK
jgi:hypothetical protein